VAASSKRPRKSASAIAPETALDAATIPLLQAGALANLSNAVACRRHGEITHEHAGENACACRESARAKKVRAQRKGARGWKRVRVREKKTGDEAKEIIYLKCRNLKFGIWNLELGIWNLEFGI
jgi:hypothetical protein